MKPGIIYYDKSNGDIEFCGVMALFACENDPVGFDNLRCAEDQIIAEEMGWT